MSCGPETCDEAPDDNDDAVLRVTTTSRNVKSLVETLLRSKPARLRRTLVVYREENPRWIGERNAQTFARRESRDVKSRRVAPFRSDWERFLYRYPQRLASVERHSARATVQKTYASSPGSQCLCCVTLLVCSTKNGHVRRFDGALFVE